MPKTVIFPFFAFIISIWITSCQNQASKEEKKPVMKNTSPYKNDGLKKSYKDGYLYTEVTIKNGKKMVLPGSFIKTEELIRKLPIKTVLKLILRGGSIQMVKFTGLHLIIIKVKLTVYRLSITKMVC